MGSHNRREVHQLRRRAHCPLISQYLDRHLDSVLASAPTVEIEYADKAKMPVGSGGLFVYPPSLAMDYSLCLVSASQVSFESPISPTYH